MSQTSAIYLRAQLALDRCPHCSIAKPNLRELHELRTANHNDQNIRVWKCYLCGNCGGVVLAGTLLLQHKPIGSHVVSEMYPTQKAVDASVPQRAREYLLQAVASLHAPAGAVMLAASAVDSMLKANGYDQGSLNSRIDKASTDHLITSEMAAWAHDIRLDANDQRHADDSATLPTEADAQKVIDFCFALAEFLFVLPSRVERGRKS